MIDTIEETLDEEETINDLCQNIKCLATEVENDFKKGGNVLKLKMYEHFVEIIKGEWADLLDLERKYPNSEMLKGNLEGVRTYTKERLPQGIYISIFEA